MDRLLLVAPHVLIKKQTEVLLDKAIGHVRFGCLLINICANTHSTS